MKDLQSFLLLCSGAHPAILRKSPTDVNKYMGIGGTVLFTAILAFIAAAYAVNTVFDNLWISIAFGIIWGLMIFNLDRYIVSSMKRRDSVWRDVLVAIPRLAIAVIIAMVISKPIELKLFEKEINGEIVLMEQEMFLAHENSVRDRFTNQVQEREIQIQSLKDEIALKAAVRDAKESEALAEADGTGGSQIRNMGPIYKIKRDAADAAQAELDDLEVLNGIQIQGLEEEIGILGGQLNDEIAGLSKAPMDGMAYRMEALDRLTNKYPPVKAGHIFIVLLFLLIESSPVLVKLISYRSPYDMHLHKHEHAVEMFYTERTKKLANSTSAEVQFDQDVTMHKVYGDIKIQRAKIDQEVKEKIARIKGEEGLSYDS